MDSSDDFEFKPLTEGLGFHKKTAKLSTETKPQTQPNVQTLEQLLKTLEKPVSSSNVQMTQPLPRNEQKAFGLPDLDLDAVAPTKSARGSFDIPQPGSEVHPSYKKKATAEAPALKRSAPNSPPPRLSPATTSVQASILDAIVISAVTLLFLVSLILVTKIDVLSVIGSAKTDLTTQLSMVLLFVAVMQMYVVVSRSFFGRTLGEWTFEYQLGQDGDHQKSLYPLKVMARSLLILFTGFLVFPILSWIMGRDLAGEITGVKLYQQKLEPLV